jgi:predicted RNA-binding protein with PUA-like domain
MAKWLFKSEPNTWGWEQQVAKGDIGEEWDGIRNYQARNFMRRMEIGDQAFFYHSVNDKCIVGVIEVCSACQPDSTTDDPRWECVSVRAIAPFPRPVTLAEIKETQDLEQMILVRNSRLSVQPVTETEWKIICDMAGYSE